jgi:hypothetical protein
MSLLEQVKENIRKNKDIKRELFNIKYVSPEIQELSARMDEICIRITKKYGMKHKSHR